MNNLLKEYGIEDTPEVVELEEAKPASNKAEKPWLCFVEDGANIFQEELPPLVEVVHGIVAEQSKLVIGGGSKSFKTWVTMDMALSIAHGIPFLQRTTVRQRVLYVNLELKPLTFKRRLQTIAKAKGLTFDKNWFLHLPLRGKLAGLSSAEIIAGIIGVAQHVKAGVVALDPIYKVNVDGDENSSRDQTLLFNNLDQITTEAKCTLVMNDHFGKGNQSEKDPLDTIRGSSAKGGDVDAAMVLRKHEVEGCYRVDLVHRELAPVEPFVIEWQYPLMRLRPDLDAGNMKKAKAGRNKAYDPIKLLAVIAETTPAQPISCNAWANAAGIPRQTLVDTYVPEMRVKGLIATVGEGNNARQHITEKGLVMVRQGMEGV